MEEITDDDPPREVMDNNEIDNGETDISTHVVEPRRPTRVQRPMSRYSFDLNYILITDMSEKNIC